MNNNSRDKLIDYAGRFGLMWIWMSWLMGFLVYLLDKDFSYELYIKSFIPFGLGGIIAYFKKSGSDAFYTPDFPSKGDAFLNMVKIYGTMYVVTIFVGFSGGYNSLIVPMVVAPIIGTGAGILMILLIYQSKSKPVKEKPLKQEPVNKNAPEQKEVSVVYTGDDLEKPLFTTHGSALWLSDKKKNYELTEAKDGKPTFAGLWLGGGFFHHKEGNLVSIAPPGTGKGGALIIPNLLWERNYKHSFVVFDPKGTNACITARFQKAQGQKVVIIDPMNLQKANLATHDIPSANFNPLDHIVDDIFNGASQIANLLIPDDPNGEKFWNQDARNLVQSILMHIMTDASYIGRRNLITFYKIMLGSDFESLLQGMILNDNVDGAISDFASGFTDMLLKSEQTFSSVRSVANGSIKWLSNPALQVCMKTSDFNPDDLENGGMTVYLCQPIQNKEGFATFSRLIIGFCLRANSKPAARPKAWVYYLLDEFPTMGVFPEVIECLAYSREYRMRLWIFAQSLSQLDQTYKQEGRHQILGNARVLQAFGITDHITQEYISKRIGNKTVKVYTKSSSIGESKSHSSYSGSGSSSGTNSTTSNNESFHGQPLIEPSDVQYDPNIITISEWGPMRLSRWQYWQKGAGGGMYVKIFHDGRADRNPNIESGENEAEFEEPKNNIAINRD